MHVVTVFVNNEIICHSQTREVTCSVKRTPVFANAELELSPAGRGAVDQCDSM
jgi:hypothetical protein